MGVVLDATGTYKTDDSFDYLCKIKIIDSTFNPLQKFSKKNKIEPFVMVFIFSPKIAFSPKVNFIGDIVYVKNF